MNGLRLLIAEETEELREALADALRDTFCICTCGDGQEALERMRTFQPDMLVLDLMLPQLDGISLLDAAAAEGMHPIVLATTRFVSSYVMASVERLGVGYLMVRPCSLKALTARVADLSQRVGEPQIIPSGQEAFVSTQLLALGVPTKLNGYIYLREAVLEMCRDMSQSLTKELYPAVAKTCGCEWEHVERSIRSAIQAAWAYRDTPMWRAYFPPDSTGQVRRPTNGAFITRLADELRVQNFSAGENLGDGCTEY